MRKSTVIEATSTRKFISGPWPDMISVATLVHLEFQYYCHAIKDFTNFGVMLCQHDELEQMEEAPFGDQFYDLDGREIEPQCAIDDEQIFYQSIDEPHRVSLDLRRWFRNKWVPDWANPNPWTLDEMLTARAAFEKWLGRRVTHTPAPLDEAEPASSDRSQPIR